MLFSRQESVLKQLILGLRSVVRINSSVVAVVSKGSGCKERLIHVGVGFIIVLYKKYVPWGCLAIL